MTDRTARIIGTRAPVAPPLEHPRGNPLTLQVSASTGSLPVNPAAMLRAELRASQLDTGLPLAVAEVLTPTGSGPWELRFSGAQLNQDLRGKPSKTFWLVVYFLAHSGERDTQHASALTLTEDGASLDDAVPPEVHMLLSQPMGDSRYAPISLTQQVAELAARLAAAEYEPMTITALTVNPSVAEVGDTVQSLAFAWTTGKPPASLSFNQGIGPVTASLTTLIQPVSITAQTVYTLTADDGTQYDGHSASRSVTVQFQHKCYWGVVATDAAPTSADILALASAAFGTSRQREITMDAPPEGRFPAFALPAAWGEPTFMDGGFISANWERIPINFQKANGNVTPYLWFRLRDRQFTSGIKFQIL